MKVNVHEFSFGWIEGKKIEGHPEEVVETVD